MTPTQWLPIIGQMLLLSAMDVKLMRELKGVSIFIIQFATPLDRRKVHTLIYSILQRVPRALLHLWNSIVWRLPGHSTIIVRSATLLGFVVVVLPIAQRFSQANVKID